MEQTTATKPDQHRRHHHHHRPKDPAELCFINYRRNLARLDVWRNKLATAELASSCGAQQYETIGCPPKTADPADPVLGLILRREEIQLEIRRLERITRPITLYIDSLTIASTASKRAQDMLNIVILRYQKRQSWEACKTKAKIAHTSFWRLKKDIIREVREYLNILPGEIISP